MPSGLIINGVKQTETDENYKKTIKYLTVPPRNRTHPDFDSDDIAKIKALEDPLRREIYDKMMGSTEEFSFPDLTTAMRHWHMRMVAINAMKAMNAGPRRIDYWYHDPNGVAVKEPGNLWKKGTSVSFFFETVAGAVPSKAMAQVVTGTTKGECLGAMDACILLGVKYAVGDTEFDAMHSSIRLGKYLRHLKAVADGNTLIPGDYLYIKNKDDYLEKSKAKNGRAGFWQGENCFYMGGGKFSGLGVRMLNKDQLREELRDAYEAGTGLTLTKAEAATAIRFTAHKRLKLSR